MPEEKKINRNPIQIWIDNKLAITVHLINGKDLNGILAWQDTYHFGLKLANKKEVFVPKHSVLYIEPI